MLIDFLISTHGVRECALQDLHLDCWWFPQRARWWSEGSPVAPHPLCPHCTAAATCGTRCHYRHGRPGVARPFPSAAPPLRSSWSSWRMHCYSPLYPSLPARWDLHPAKTRATCWALQQWWRSHIRRGRRYSVFSLRRPFLSYRKKKHIFAVILYISVITFFKKLLAFHKILLQISY